MIAGVLDNVVKQLEGAVLAEEDCSSELFDSVTYALPDKLIEFIGKHDIAVTAKTDFKESVLRQCKIREGLLSEADIGGQRKTLDMVTGDYVEEQRKDRILRICKEMVDCHISVEDIVKGVKAEEEKKLQKSTSQ